MAQICQAIYEHGVLRLLTPIELKEQQKVSLLILEDTDLADEFRKIYSNPLAYEDKIRANSLGKTAKEIIDELDIWEEAFNQKRGTPCE